MRLLDRLLHRVPWSGDKLRLYNAHTNPPTFVGEFVIKMQKGNVTLMLVDATVRTYIRGDLPKWNQTEGCWEYSYGSSVDLGID